MMDVTLFQSHLDSYSCTNAEEEFNALREMLQEMILASLSRTDFFSKAAFQGGTRLRIFDGIRRYSEDLDFSLMSPDLSFELRPYLDSIATELASMGIELEVVDKSKLTAAVKKGFLKNDTLVRILVLKYLGKDGQGKLPKIAIKLEVDANPPLGATYCVENLFFPFLAAILNYDHESAFAGKMHALLCRDYVKGRDWFDFVWYVGAHIRLNHQLLSAALNQYGPWAGKGVVSDDSWVKEKLVETISRIDWEAAKRDVMSFVFASDRPSVKLWSKDLFLSLAQNAF
ncbi:MAG: nucleotidyl transferase AbiEii/AbiGii toxin family protein [Victivallales bacterium]|nr:nucleotidyl transferase AbiEii/AbiGii toxin family protein [Victivallales bacterium]